MFGNRQKLRFLYLFLCVLQLAVLGLGLAVAYQLQVAHARNIEYEKAVNAEHRTVNELEVLARVLAPNVTNWDDESLLSQLSQINYTAKLFLNKTEQLLEQSKNSPESPVARSQDDLQSLITQIKMVSEQSQMAAE